jgi:glycosyltransferase involved in cell wall biosynthesis
MAVDTSAHKFRPKHWNQGPLRFICVARDVPHKNFTGAIQLCEEVQKISGREVELITITNKEFTSDKIKITSYINPDNIKRDELLAEAHFNLLLSLDHSDKGFFEGFGQIVQEAGMYGTPSLVMNTGGLPESVHDKSTGWVIGSTSSECISSWWSSVSEDEYRRISEHCYQHTLESHGLGAWSKLFHALLIK